MSPDEFANCANPAAMCTKPSINGVLEPGSSLLKAPWLSSQSGLKSSTHVVVSLNTCCVKSAPVLTNCCSTLKWMVGAPAGLGPTVTVTVALPALAGLAAIVYTVVTVGFTGVSAVGPYGPGGWKGGGGGGCGGQD